MNNRNNLYVVDLSELDYVGRPVKAPRSREAGYAFGCFLGTALSFGAGFFGTLFLIGFICCILGI